MKLDSPLFDRIRVKPEEDRRPDPSVPRCMHPGCQAEGQFRAPRGRGHEGEYLLFCFEHVKAYNAKYNYFDGMDDEKLAAYQKDALTGHRPTWKMGQNRAAQRSRGPAGVDDLFGLFGSAGFKPQQDRGPSPEKRIVRNAERKALTTLGLDADATPAETKAKFKELAKRMHPDSNGGDRSHEDKLREIIQAYNYLKRAGFV